MSLSQAFADSPWYPRVLLNKGDHAVLIAPEAIFNHEIARMKFPPAQFAAKPATDSYEIQTAEAELSDLAIVLRRDATPEPECKLILDAHAEARARLRRGDAADATDGLPKEFASYFRGSIALRNGDTASARYEWESILNLPPAERHFKSTWAAFMLAKLLMENEPARAIEYFQQVRKLTSLAFADSAGLATASIGWEARVHRLQGDFRRSLELYIEQHSAGDESALNSLRFVASAALYESKNLSQLVTNATVRRVVTAYAISGDGIYWPDSGEPHQAIAKWLAAVGSVEITDPDEMEMLAMAAYRGAVFDVAQRWLKRAPATAVTLWLQAKLQLRAGKVNQALGLLARAHATLPDRPEDEESPHDTLADNVFIPDGNISAPAYPRRNGCLAHGSPGLPGGAR